MQSLWMLVASLLFACMGVCVKFASAHFGSAEIVFWRGFIALLMMSAVVHSQRISLRTPHWRRQFSRGISGFIALVLYFYAIALLPLATAVTINYTAPLFLSVLLVVSCKEKPRRHLFMAVALGFIGTAVLLQPTFSWALWLPIGVAILSALMASVAYLNVRELGALGEHEARTVFYFSLFTTLGSLPWLLYSRQRWLDISYQEWGLLLGVGIFGGCAQLAMTRAYRYGKTLVSASLAYFTVIFSSLFGWLFWSEPLEFHTLSGMGLIIAGGLIASWPGRISTK